MDDEMAEAVDEAFVCFEVDLDYEFDAPRYFDLGREETPVEARAAELWFDTARSYPPSPLIAKLIFGKDIPVANTSTVCNLEDSELPLNGGAQVDAVAPEFSIVCDIDRGCTFRSSMLQGVSKVDHKPIVKNPLSKRSTLMKPTASQLAKQNRREVKSISRFRKQLEARKQQNFEDLNDYTHQAAKRQRLETGHCCKVTGVKQQFNLFHKVPEKENEIADANNRFPRLKLTIPREPELATARRALTIRAQQQRSDGAKYPVEGRTHTTSTFKARPLNRKILAAPSLPLPQKSTPRLPKFKEFNLRTYDRALQHNTTASSLISSSHIHTAIGDMKCSVRKQSQSSVHQQLQDEGKRTAEIKYMPSKFKAQALERKILASKGDIGVFRSTKREITVPKEFSFSTTKRFQQNPLTELFNKLSLTTEAQTNALPKFPLPSHLDNKLQRKCVSKEETWNLGEAYLLYIEEPRHLCP